LVKKAFTIIELIFASVVISIVVLAIPTLIQVSSKNVENNLAQEAIFAASAELMGASSAYWDENSTHDANESTLSRVIDIDNDCNATTHLRPGHINQPFHRRCLDDNAIGAQNSSGGVTYDLNDLAHGSQTVFTGAADASGYKKDYNSALDVNVSTINPNDHNVKIITVTITDPDDSSTITKLKLQAANIGEVEPYKKRMF